ncbi:MarR family transcriptional regulator [Bacillus sp. SB49]|nr:MarR family transcriptional regulator [Bacillus sp. SB49]
MSDRSVEVIERQVTDFIRRIVLTEKQDDSLERSAYILLRQLTTYGPAGVKALSEDLHLDVSTISRQAAALVAKGYVEKIPNPNDGRAYFYRITKLGSEELEGNKQRRFERLSRVLSDWTDEEQETFGRLLKKYNETINKRLNL